MSEDDNLVTQCGRSMIEMLGVLAIIGVLSVGGIAGYSKAMMKFKINKTAQQITEIATNIQTLYAQQKNYNGLTNETAIQMGVIPDEIVMLDNIEMKYYIRDALGGNVEILENWYDDKVFGVVINSVHKEACMSLLSADWGTSSSSGIVGVAIGTASHVMWNVTSECKGSGYRNGYYYACTDSLPISPAIASQYCTNWSYGHTLTFFFK